MNKHEKALVHANTTPHFMIPTGIAKELADAMQVWTLNESTCPPAVRQLPDRTLHLHHVDFYIWLKNILPKEDTKVFKLQFWKLFVLNDWFKILTNDSFSQKGSVNGCMQLNAHKKCLLLEMDLEPSSLVQWLGNNAGLTTQLVEEVVKPYAAWHVEHLLLGTTWNEASSRPHKSASHAQSPPVKPWCLTQSKYQVCSNEWLKTSHSIKTMTWSLMNRTTQWLVQVHARYLYWTIQQYCRMKTS